MRITAARPLVLGSASPRRRELLGALGVPYMVHAAPVDEELRRGEMPDEYLVRITRAKLDAVRHAAPAGAGGAVLVADTIVVSPGGAVLGKPESVARATGTTESAATRAMIASLEGATHLVSTRFALAESLAGAAPAHEQTVTTRVTFRRLAAGEAEAYAESGEGFDKAGGYAAQGRAAAFIERIDGSYTGVVGLPLCELAVALRALGWW